VTGVLGVNNRVCGKIFSKTQLHSFGITPQMKCPLCLNFVKAPIETSCRHENFTKRFIGYFELLLSVSDEWDWVIKGFCGISSD
jgi:hypothetical protein